MGLVVSQELCWSHTWRVPGAGVPRQADAHPTWQVTVYPRPVSLWLPQARWVCAPMLPCRPPSPRTHRWPRLTFSLCQKQNKILLPLGEGYRLRIRRGPGPFLSLEMIKNPISFYASRTHQVMCSPDHRITPKEAWKVQYHHLQTALRHGWLGFNPDWQMTECWSQFNPNSPHVTLQTTFLPMGMVGIEASHVWSHSHTP